MGEIEHVCRCKGAVIRAYRELRERGITDRDAFDSVARIHRFYHPEVSPRQSRFVIAEWLDPED